MYHRARKKIKRKIKKQIKFHAQQLDGANSNV